MSSYYNTMGCNAEKEIARGSFGLPSPFPVNQPASKVYSASEIQAQLQASNVVVAHPESPAMIIQKIPKLPISYTAEIRQNIRISFPDPIVEGAISFFGKEFAIVNHICNIGSMVILNVNSTNAKINIRYGTSSKIADSIENYRYTIIDDRDDLKGKNIQNEIGESEQIDNLDIGTHSVISNFLIRNKNFDMLT